MLLQVWSVARHQEAPDKAHEEGAQEGQGYHHIIEQQVYLMKQNLDAFFVCFGLLETFCKTCVSLGHLVSKTFANFHAFRLRLCFLVVVPFNLKCKLQ